MRRLIGCGGVIAVLWMALSAAFAQVPEEVDFDELRAQMILVVRLHAERAHAHLGIERPPEPVLKAMGRVPRHRFVPDELVPLAYFDSPLPVGHEQNIAQPYIIALMTGLARIGPGDRVFETGTGAGYHAAVLAELGAEIYSVEIVAPLAERAAAILDELGYDRVRIRVADGYDGWPEEAPFDAIIVKESVVEVPQRMIDQLAAGGRMVVPIGPPEGEQFLTVIEKDVAGRISRRKVLPVRFSPFQGGRRT